MRAWFCWLLVLPLAGCGAKTPPPAPQLKTVLAHEVRVDPGAQQAEYSGEVRARHEISQAFRVGGKLLARLVDVGDRVTAGQVLARLDAADLTLSSSGAEANLAAVDAERNFARAEVQRYRDLHARQFVSQALLDAKEAALQSAEERHRALSAQVGIAHNQRGYAELRADADGVVAQVLAEAGQVLAAGQPVAKVAQSGEREVLVAVPENRVAELSRAGEVAVVLWAAPERRYRGRVREVAPQADPVTRTYAARIAILDADAGVRLGMTARVAVNRGTREAVFLIPTGAVFQQGKQPAVWLIGEDGHVRLRPITVAAWREDGVAVSGGLVGGERIVAAGAHKLVKGEAVRVAAR